MKKEEGMKQEYVKWKRLRKRGIIGEADDVRLRRMDGLEGYFTVEAAMVLPMVCVVVILIVYLWFFQYNRCLMEQDMGVLALRGAAMQGDNTERIDKLREQADTLYTEKYIAWDRGEIALAIGHGVVTVEQTGSIRLPFGKSAGGANAAEVTVSYENHLVSPVSFVRNYRKTIGGE